MARFDLFLISGLILFLELACIRWLPAHVLFLSFFTNTVLLAGFVGMSVGCLTARKPGRALDTTPFWLVALIALGLLVHGFRSKFERHTDVGNQARPEVVFFGAEVSAVRPVEFRVPVEVVAGAFFLLTAAVFVGPGQELGRAFTRVPDRTTAYALDLIGSVTGIGLFALCSAFQMPPVVWFGVAAVGLGYFLRKPTAGLEDSTRPAKTGPALRALGAAVAMTLVTSGFFPVGAERALTTWSPYYRVDFQAASRVINTNLIGHQVMSGREVTQLSQYDLPYLLLKATARPAPKRVLIIGSGSGNDVSRALRWCPPDAVIDAVEIDPVIRGIGIANHPDKPYADPRVVSHLNDGRNFLRRAPAGEYDLVVFALVDSLVLHSGYSNLRLESYLFTQESFGDVARVLKPTGQAVVYNFFRQGWIVARIRDELRAAFGGADPVSFVDPPTAGDRVDPDDTQFSADGGALTALVAGPEAVVGPLRAAFAAGGGVFWMPKNPGPPETTAGAFGSSPPAGGEYVPLKPVTIGEAADLPPATDDWPFLYVRRPTVPDLTLRGIVLTVVLSGVLWLIFRDRSRSGGVEEKGSGGEKNTSEPDSPTPPLPDSPTSSDSGLLARSFLLGAGFMLVETKAVVQMALLFGSTWTVNTVVFAAVLVMALAGNLFAGWVKPRTLWPYYAGLFLALGANLAVPPDSFLGMDRGTQILASCSLAFAPILFAGVIFPVSFARSPKPDRFFGANVAGALAGGLAENLSMLLGFQYLLLVAFGLYGLSGLFGGRGFGTSRPERGV